MDIKQVLQARANRRTRAGRPFTNFFEMAQQCIAAGDMILIDAIDPKIKTLMERSTVISLVTAIEVYYRDILDFIFRDCAPSYFEPKLKKLFPEKYDISEILEIYRHSVHPLELVSAAQSFQNIDRIDKVFSPFLSSGGLWDTVFRLRVRVKNNPDRESSFQREDLAALKRIFDLRHELVHNPARCSFFTEQTLEDIWTSVHMIAGSDMVLTRVIRVNRDVALEKEEDAGPHPPIPA